MTGPEIVILIACSCVVAPIGFVLGRRLAIWRAARLAQREVRHSTDEYRLRVIGSPWQDDDGLWHVGAVYSNDASHLAADECGPVKVPRRSFLPDIIAHKLHTIKRPVDDGPITQEKER